MLLFGNAYSGELGQRAKALLSLRDALGELESEVVSEEEMYAKSPLPSP